MAQEVGLNSAQVDAIRRGYTILESAGGYYVHLDNGVAYEPDHLDNDVIVLDHEDFWTIEQAALETTSEVGISVTVFYDDEDRYDFYEVSMDEFDDEPTVVNEDYQLGSDNIGSEDSKTGRKTISHPSSMKEGLATTWSHYDVIVGIEDVVVGHGVEETTSTIMDVEYGEYMGPLSGDGTGDLRQEPLEAEDIEPALSMSTEQHLFEAWKQIDNDAAKASVSEALYILGYNIEATGHKLVEFSDE